MEDRQFNQLIAVLKEVQNSQENISNKLSILISPQFKRDKKKQDKKITRGNIKRLKDCGIDYKEIASILDMREGTVANELSYLKKKEGGRNAKEN